MPNMIDYIDWRGDLTIGQDPFNEVDNLILSEFCFLDLEGIVPAAETGDGITVGSVYSVLARTDNKLPPLAAAFEGIVGREPYPVADKARSILDRLIQFGVARFKALFKTSRSRSEVVATFLAILELCKANRIHLAGTAEDCTVTSTVDGLPEDVDVTVESY